jgi:hypothetical protein
MEVAPMTSMKASRLGAGIALLAGLVFGTQVLASDLSNKFRLECSGGADSVGVVTIVVTPDGGEPIETLTELKKGTSENHVAKAIVEALKAQLPKDQFHIERDDGEDVLVKRRAGEHRFRIAVISITAKGVRINVNKE